MRVFRLACLRILLGVLAIVFPAVACALVVGEFPGFSFPENLAADAGGNVWFTSADNLLRRIAPDGVVAAFPLPAGRAFVSGGGIVAGPDGNIWFASRGLIRATPSGVMTEFALPTADVPVAMTVGPDGNIWFTTGAGPIGRATMSGDITTFHVGASIDYSPVTSIAAGPDGNLWFTTSNYGGIGRITIGGTVTRFQVSASESAAYGGIVPGSDGNMWFADHGNNRIGRITPAGGITYFSVPSIRRGTNSITTGPDGNIWFQEEGSLGKFGVLSSDGVLSELSVLPAQDEPTGLGTNFTTSPDGLIWFTRYLSGKIGFFAQATTAGYFPLTPGATWTYSVNGGASSITRTAVPGTTNINGANTTLLSESSGSGMYLTNDAEGIREHRESDPSGDVTFSPPIIYGSATGTVMGSALISSGTASGTVSGVPFSLSYSHSAVMQAIETVTVPAGTFRAARIQLSLTLPGITATETDWFANGVGVVKGIADADTYALTNTSLPVTTPDIFSYVVPRAAPPITRNTFTVTGITAAAPISISGGEYSVDGGPYTAASGSVANGQSVMVRPAALVNPLVKQAVVTIGGVAGVFNAMVPPVPSVTLSTASLGFGTQTVGTTSSAQGVTLTNSGNGMLSISNIAASGDYGYTTTCSATLAPEASCAISLSFSPTASGERTGLLSIASNASGSPHTASLSGTGEVPDTQAPTIPQGLSAISLGPDRIGLSWTASTDNVGVSGYAVFRDGGSTPIATLAVTSYANSTLAASTSYGYTVVACDAAGNCSAPSAVATATTLEAGSTAFSPQILAKWNLLGNTGTVVLDVTALFGTQDAPIAGVSQHVLSVWKWVVNADTGAGRWAFFTPSLTKAESDAAALEQGYAALSTINPGEGFWVNRTTAPGLTTAVALNGPASGPFYYDAVNFAALKMNAWHLIATDSPAEPSVFNSSDVSATPPGTGAVPTGNFQTLWAWSATAQKWYFYAASIEANGYASATGTLHTGLDAVRQAAVDGGYLDFHTTSKTLGTGVGFWVRR